MVFSVCLKCSLGYLIAVSERSSGFSGRRVIVDALVARSINLAVDACGKTIHTSAIDADIVCCNRGGT